MNLVSFSLWHLLKHSDRKNNTPYWLIRKIKNLLARDRFIYIWNIYKIRLNIIKPLSLSCHWHYDFKKSTSQKIYTETSKCHLRYSILVFIYISSIVSRIVFKNTILEDIFSFLFWFIAVLEVKVLFVTSYGNVFWWFLLFSALILSVMYLCHFEFYVT